MLDPHCLLSITTNDRLCTALHCCPQLAFDHRLNGLPLGILSKTVQPQIMLHIQDFVMLIWFWHQHFVLLLCLHVRTVSGCKCVPATELCIASDNQICWWLHIGSYQMLCNMVEKYAQSYKGYANYRLHVYRWMLPHVCDSHSAGRCSGKHPMQCWQTLQNANELVSKLNPNFCCIMPVPLHAE